MSRVRAVKAATENHQIELSSHISNIKHNAGQQSGSDRWIVA